MREEEPNSLTTSRFSRVLPFLKWPGGKRWAAPTVSAIVADALRGTYYEPFLGGGAIFFSIQPNTAVLSDLNADLINTYRVVRDRSDELLEAVRQIPVSKAEYDRQRSSTDTDPLARAARFLFLNRTAFGGMYRINSKGEFNVPFGGGSRNPELLWKRGLLKQAASALSRAELEQSDFQGILERATKGDVCYCDPTYTVAHDNNGFVRYNERNFSWSDQKRLALTAEATAARGATVIVSNACHPAIRALYPRRTVHVLSRTSCLSRNSQHRRSVDEYLIILRPRRRR